MEIIAKTESGCLIQATNEEVTEILRAVNGTPPEDIAIGQRLPAIDYAATITKIRTLQDDYIYKAMLDRIENFFNEVDLLKFAVAKASAIEA